MILKPIVIYYAMLFLCSLILSLSPISGAFSYEFSFFLTFPIFLLSGFFHVQFFERLKKQFRINFFILFMIFPLSCIALLISIIPIFLSSYPTCDFWMGFKYFFLFPLLGNLFMVSSAGFSSSFHFGFFQKVLLTYLIPIFFTLINLTDLLYSPSLSFMNPVLGFFHGPLYDELILLPKEFYSFRLWTFILSISLLFSLSFPQQFITKTSVLLINICLISVFFLRFHLGWSTNYSKLEKTLSAKVIHPKITLYFKKGEMSSEQAMDKMKDLLFFRKEVQQTLNSKTYLGQKPVRVFLYPNSDLKKKLTGSRFTLIGNPIQRSVHVLNLNVHSSYLKHELTHVLASQMGYLGLSPRIGLLEGLATASENYRGKLSIHEWARCLQNLELLPDISQSLSPWGFWRQAPQRVYLANGSFSLWLIKNFGFDKYAQIYRGEAFQKVYQQSLDELVQNWKDFIQTIEVPEETLKQIETYLKRKSTFERRCVHDVAFVRYKMNKCDQKDTICIKDCIDELKRYSDHSVGSLLTEIRFALKKKNLTVLQTSIQELRKKKNLPDQVIEIIKYYQFKKQLLLQKNDEATETLFDIDVSPLPLFQFLEVQSYLQQAPQKPQFTPLDTEEILNTDLIDTLLFQTYQNYHKGKFSEALEGIDNMQNKSKRFSTPRSKNTLIRLTLKTFEHYFEYERALLFLNKIPIEPNFSRGERLYIEEHTRRIQFKLGSTI